MADLHSFGDYCRGDGPRAGNRTQMLFKNNGASTAPQTDTRLAGSLDLAKPRKTSKLADPTRHVDSASTTSARQPNPAQPKLH